jgi:cyclopropane-fatty-acyl-phospholipid synthase
MITKTQILKKILSKIEYGTLQIQFPSGKTSIFGKTQPKATLNIHNKKAISAILSEGDIGFGRGYIENCWSCDDIVTLLDIIVRNISHFEKAIYGKRFYNFIYRIYDFLHRNTIAHSKKNIEYHYDLGNNFYFKWLDETKSYSSALFFGNETLEDAQKNKYRNIIKYLPNDVQNILEIGCGWGGFMQEMLEYKPDIKIKGLTLSNEQFIYVQEKFTANHNIKAVIQDYRDENSKHDAVVSIEMFEAVGMEYWKTYMKKVYDCLKSGGVAVIQTITIDESVFEKYTKTSDFIRHFIFPGGALPTKEIFQNIAKECGFEIIAMQNFGDCYKRTLLKWLKNFDSVKNDILSIGFDEKFTHKWRFYLAYCAAGFGLKRTDVYQFVLRRI